jgi:hypothetical protein
MSLPTAAEALAEARRQSEAATKDATSAGTASGVPFDTSVEAGQHPGGIPLVPPAPAEGEEPGEPSAR